MKPKAIAPLACARALEPGGLNVELKSFRQLGELRQEKAGIQALFPASRDGLFLASGASPNDDMLIIVSTKVPAMLMSRTSRLAVEVLVRLTAQGSQEWMNAAELGRRIDAELSFLKQLLNRLTRAGHVEEGLRAFSLPTSQLESGLLVVFLFSTARGCCEVFATTCTAT